MVNFQKEFLKAKFNIEHLKGLIGNSMGGFEALAWACMYPDSVDFVVSLVSSYKVGGHNYALSRIMNNILESDPDYNGGDYELPISDSLKRSLKLSSDVCYPYGLSWEEYRNNMTNEEIGEAMAEFAEESLVQDVNDVVYRNNSSLDFDLTDDLSNITAKVLIIAINQDRYFPPYLDAVPMSKLIKDNKLVIFDSLMGHVGSYELNKIEGELEEFISEFRD
jgi:homoserine O-acetyltransferase